MLAQSAVAARSAVKASGAAAGNEAIAALTAAKARFLIPMIVICVVGYIGLTILAGFAKGFMATKVVGSFNIGFLLIVLNYGLAWVLALVYVRIANTVFDPMMERVIAKTGHPGVRQ